MEVQTLSFPEVKKIRLKSFPDNRGFFREAYRSCDFPCPLVQDNYSFSHRGVIRGMHFQSAPGQAKLVTILEGLIFDVVVDIRVHSATFGKWEGVYLDSTLADQLWIPKGFAHGFCVISDRAHVFYKVSSFYEKEEERTFRYDDPSVGIEWPCQEPMLSERDKNAPLLEEMIQR